MKRPAIPLLKVMSGVAMVLGIVWLILLVAIAVYLMLFGDSIQFG